MYRVDRISELTVDEAIGAFTKPNDFDIRLAVDAHPWETGVDPALEATLRFDADMAWWAARSLGLDEPSAELEAKVTVSNRDAFIGWLLSFGSSAEVVSPPELRQAVAERVDATLRSLS